MGNIRSQPDTEKHVEKGEGNGLRYAISSMQGWRLTMEDTHDIRLGLGPGFEDWSFFSVFDGHAGHGTALYAANNLLDFILDKKLDKLKEPVDQVVPNSLEIEQAFLDIVSFEDPEKESPSNNPKSENQNAQTSNSNQKSDSNQQAKPKKLDNLHDSPNNNQLTKKEDNCNSEATNTSNSNSKSVKKEQEEKPNNKLDHGKESAFASNEPQSSNDGEKSSLDKEACPKLDASVTQDISNQVPGTDSPEIPDEPSGLIEAFEKQDFHWIMEHVKLAFLRLDQSLRMASHFPSGSTAVCAIVTPKYIVIANCGDSRALLYSDRSTAPRFATEDHKPYVYREKKRIIEAGGTATQRINGALAVSRALGDFEFKSDTRLDQCSQLVSPEPDVTIVPRCSGDNIMILACDGIWDVMDQTCLYYYVEYLLKIHQDIRDVCNQVIECCLSKGSKDNMSIIIVVFENGVKYDPDFAREVEEHMDEIMKFVDERLSTDEFAKDGTFETLMSDITAFIGDRRNYIPRGAGMDGISNIIRERYEATINEFYKTNKWTY